MMVAAMYYALPKNQYVARLGPLDVALFERTSTFHWYFSEYCYVMRYLNTENCLGREYLWPFFGTMSLHFFFHLFLSISLPSVAFVQRQATLSNNVFGYCSWKNDKIPPFDETHRSRVGIWNGTAYTISCAFVCFLYVLCICAQVYGMCIRG